MNKRYWLRGLIIVSLVGFFLVLNTIGATQCVFGANCDVFSRLWIGIRWFPIYLVDGSSTAIQLITFYVVIPGLIGAFLGWFYGKIKNRNKVN